jgi:hypothetical protein
MDGIHIPREVADSAQVPEDLDSGVVGPYRFPDPGRRRIAAFIYLVTAGVAATTLPGPWRWAGALGVLLAAWHWLAAWPLGLQVEQALATAAAAAPFPVGHASAALTFHGLRARPRWHVIIYDTANPPSSRALIVIDAVTATVTGGPYVEDLSRIGT